MESQVHTMAEFAALPTEQARHLVETLAANPPEPFHGACAKVALACVLRCLKIAGLYYEHDYYETLKMAVVSPVPETEVESLSVESLNGLVDMETAKTAETILNTPLTAPERTILPNSLRSTVEFEADEQQVKAKLGRVRDEESAVGAIFTVGGKEERTTVRSPAKPSGVDAVSLKAHTHHRNNAKSDSSRDVTCVRKRHPETTNKISFYREGRKQETRGQVPSSPVTSGMMRKKSGSIEISLSSLSSAVDGCEQHSPANPGNYLDRCGLIQNPLASPVLQALGYCSERSHEVVLEEQYTKTGSRRVERTGWRCIFSDRTYAFCVMLLLWANLLRICQYIVNDHGVAFPMLVIATLWFIMTAANSTWLFVSCTKHTHFLLFFQRWNLIYADPVTRGLGLRGLVSTSFNTKVLVVMATAVCSNFLSCAGIMLLDDDFSAGMNRVFYVTGYRSVVTIIVSFAVVFICTCAWTFPVALVVAICQLIISHFEEFEEIFRLHVTAAGHQFPKHLRMLRECHLAMCDTVGIADRYIRMASGCLFSVAISSSCFLLYVLVNFSLDVTVSLVVVFWLLASVVMVGFITHFMGSVSSAMHSVDSSLQTLQTRAVSPDQLGQLQMFFSKVNGPTMGFSVFGLITVTRELSLTLLSLYITYAVVLLQFQ